MLNLDVRNLIIVDKLCKSYGRRPALQDVDLIMPSNGIVAVVGSSGAGKTTFLKLLAGLEKPSSGRCFVLGRQPYDNGRVLKHIYYDDKNTTYEYNLTPDKILDRQLLLNPHFIRDAAESFAFSFRLDLNQKFIAMSLAQKVQFNIVMALAMNRRVTIFDEPVADLDENSRRVFYDMIKDMARIFPTKLFIISTNLLNEIYDCAHTILILNHRHIVACAPPENFRNRLVRFTGRKGDLAKLVGNLNLHESVVDAQEDIVNIVTVAKEFSPEQNEILERGLALKEFLSGQQTCRIMCDEPWQETLYID